MPVAMPHHRFGPSSGGDETAGPAPLFSRWHFLAVATFGLLLTWVATPDGWTRPYAVNFGYLLFAAALLSAIAQVKRLSTPGAAAAKGGATHVTTFALDQLDDVNTIRADRDGAGNGGASPATPASSLKVAPRGAGAGVVGTAAGLAVAPTPVLESAVWSGSLTVGSPLNDDLDASSPRAAESPSGGRRKARATKTSSPRMRVKSGGAGVVGGMVGEGGGDGPMSLPMQLAATMEADGAYTFDNVLARGASPKASTPTKSSRRARVPMTPTQGI